MNTIVSQVIQSCLSEFKKDDTRTDFIDPCIQYIRTIVYPYTSILLVILFISFSILLLVTTFIQNIQNIKLLKKSNV